MAEYLILREFDSGTMGLAYENGKLYLQFNCSCEDALLYCKAMCCKGRPQSNVTLTEEEAKRFLNQRVKVHGRELPVLAWTGSECYYLSSADQCLVHKEKPAACVKWHCSPGGKGDDIETRDKGWVLNPAFEAK